MRRLSTGEVARMQEVQVESFNDQVTLHSYTQYQDSFGQLFDSFDSGTLIDAGLTTNKQFLNYRGEVVTIDADAVLRVAATQIVDIGDKVIGRGVTYFVDGVYPGRHVNIAGLKENRV